MNVKYRIDIDRLCEYVTIPKGEPTTETETRVHTELNGENHSNVALLTPKYMETITINRPSISEINTVKYNIVNGLIETILSDSIYGDIDEESDDEESDDEDLFSTDDEIESAPLSIAMETLKYYKIIKKI